MASSAPQPIPMPTTISVQEQVAQLEHIQNTTDRAYAISQIHPSNEKDEKYLADAFWKTFMLTK
jgi:hypothetical protein